MNDRENKEANIIDENRKLKIKISEIDNEKKNIEQERNQLLNELIETRNSKTYKLARVLTGISRFFQGRKYVHSRVYGTQTVYPYMISVVMAVYNTADFLEEMLESVLKQKQDVLSNYLRSNPNSRYYSNAYESIYEIILVDDGSSDGTEDICDRYAAKYPWVKVLHKENGGVSSARNAGIELATGKYITFPDSDDKLSANVFEDCFLFFEKHENDISMVTYPLRFFDAQQGDHWTTYRFADGTRIINMVEEWDKPQYFTAASFFKTATIKGKISFDSNLINGEDIKFAHEVLFQNTPLIGLVSTCTYWYRRRSSGCQSAIQQSKQTENYYIPYVTDMLGGLKYLSEQVYGNFPKYVQYAIMGQFQWRLRSDPKGEEAVAVIGEDGYKKYCQLIKKLISYIDYDVILSQKQLFREHLFYLCMLKSNGRVERVCEDNNVKYYFDGQYCTEEASTYIKLLFMEIKHGILSIEGECASLDSDCEVWAQMGDRQFKVEKCVERDCNVYTLGEIALHVLPFVLHIELSMIEEKSDIVFGCSCAGFKIIKTQVNLGKFMPISKTFLKSYYATEKWTIQLRENVLEVWNMFGKEKLPDFENEFEEQVLNSGLICEETIDEVIKVRKEALARLAWKRNSNTQIWLVSDRYSHADDNGEAMFRFFMEHKRPDIKVFFVMDRESADYDRIAKIGPVIAQDSHEHLVMYMISDCIISSQADEYIINPFWRHGAIKDVFKDFYCRNKFVFLQHGVIKDDLSGWLNRFNKNIAGFVCAAIPEAESIHECEYYYDKQIWLTGLPRYDRLYHDEKKNILIMPTWRKWLMKNFNAADSDKDATHVIDNIEQTEFFEFYSGLLNSERLLDACKKYGYKLCYMPHTNFRECMSKFCKDERIQQFDLNMPYRQAFAEANLLVTDYSSTAMDFVYLRKPVIYAQFDKEKFFSGEHTYRKGYFDYEKDGFGEVVYELDELIDLIITYMENECNIDDKYRERVKNFFAYNDKNNCQRVYERITKLCLKQ